MSPPKAPNPPLGVAQQKNMAAHIHVLMSRNVSLTCGHLTLDVCLVSILPGFHYNRLTLVPVLFSFSRSRAMSRSSPRRRNLAVVGEFGSKYHTSGEAANDKHPMKMKILTCVRVAQFSYSVDLPLVRLDAGVDVADTVR